MRSVDRLGDKFIILTGRILLQLRTVAAIALACCLAAAAKAAPQTEPLTIVCDWDFAPYEFLDNKGSNDGYCIEVLHTILKSLDIPHKFVMGSRQHAVDSFFCHKADLIVDYGDRFTGNAYCRSLSILGYNHFVLARNRSSRPISRVEQIHGQKVAVNVINDSIPYDVIMQFMDRSDLQVYNGREALGELESGKLDYFLWGREPMKWKIREYNLQDVVIDSLNIDAKEIHVVGYNQKLINDIDNQYARLQQGGKINEMRERWFHPERVAEHTSPVVRYVVLAALLIAISIYAAYRLTIVRVRKALSRNSMIEAMMHQALSMGDYAVITNNLRRNLVTNQHGHAVPDEGVTMEQMLEHMHPDDREAMVVRREKMRELKGKPYPYRMRWNYGTKEKPDWHTVTGFSYPEMGHLPMPKNIVIISRDITDELRREQEEHDMTSRYMKMFESSLIAMTFYDKDGNLINLNENMKKLCEHNDDILKYFWTTNLFDTVTFKDDLKVSPGDNLHTCSRMYYPAVGVDKYVEHRVKHIYDDDGKLLYYTVTARDVSDERNMYLEQQRQLKALDDTSKANSRYEHELRTLLVNSNMYVWHLEVDTQVISFSRSLHGDVFTMTLEEYIAKQDAAQREKLKHSYEAVIQSGKPFNVTRQLSSTSVSDAPAWFAISGMSITDAEGHVKTLFGVVRNVTSLMQAQQRLREETARAENSTMLKSTFLANMTHEIRTPLNAIVGFSDLLQTVTNPEERKEFIGIIHNNCDMLMRLINDIFEASSLDIKPLTIVPRRVDFAQEFILVCQSLEQRVQEPAVKFIVENPAASFVTVVDMGRIQQVITNFVINAVKYTHKGHIRVGWNYEHGGLHIFCEDTGTGIPKEKQARVFDRFVKLNDFMQGTGLGLAISKSIAQGCGGKIGLESEGEGRGSTFWIWIPCQEVK